MMRLGDCLDFKPHPILYNFLESVIVLFYDVLRKKVNGTIFFLCNKLRNFTYIYIFYFLVDVFYNLTFLLKKINLKL